MAQPLGLDLSEVSFFLEGKGVGMTGEHHIFDLIVAFFPLLFSLYKEPEQGSF